MSSSALTQADKKFWAPVDQVVQWLANRLPEDAKVLEIGPGYVPFPRTTMFVDYKDLPNIPSDKKISIDLATQKLPFEDKSFDFIYCRHVLEDMYNPFLLVDEMSRVGKAGYIEMPSPIAELGRGVDGGSPPYRGYHHHRFMAWVHEGQLRFISKYPFVEYLRFTEEDIASSLREGAQYWNTYYLWTDKINYAHRQNGPDYDVPRDYASILKSAMDQSRISSGMFWLELPKSVEINQSALPSLTSSNS